MGLTEAWLWPTGHDDRVCAYTSFEALMRIKNPEKTCVALMVDKEEIGSVGATGMTSRFLKTSGRDYKSHGQLQ